MEEVLEEDWVCIICKVYKVSVNDYYYILLICKLIWLLKY